VSDDSIRLRSANVSDLPAITEILTASKLPAADIGDHLSSFVVLEADGAIAAVGGAELFPTVALLRSLAVAPRYRGRGVAGAICDRLEAEAFRRGVAALYVLTETAESFFAYRGYVRVSRADAPPEIAATKQFSGLCSTSAVLMRRDAPRGTAR
jgi:amino-acid N-acetyltransferase